MTDRQLPNNYLMTTLQLIFKKNNSPFYSIQGFSNPYMRQGGIGASATWGGYGQHQSQQPSGIGASATWGGYGQPQPQQPSGIGASATWGGYSQPQPSYPYSSYPQIPSFGGIGASATWGGYQVGGSAGYYPNGNYGQYNPVQVGKILHIFERVFFPMGLLPTGLLFIGLFNKRPCFATTFL